jgi:hypothetical protein
VEEGRLWCPAAPGKLLFYWATPGALAWDRLDWPSIGLPARPPQPSVPKLVELAEKARGAALPDLAWRCIRLIVARAKQALESQH